MSWLMLGLLPFAILGALIVGVWCRHAFAEMKRAYRIGRTAYEDQRADILTKQRLEELAQVSERKRFILNAAARETRH